MRTPVRSALLVSAVIFGAVAWTVLDGPADAQSRERRHRVGDDAIRDNARQQLEQGRQTFRFDTFGDEAFWGDTLKLHQAIAGAAIGGVGPGVSPKTALAVGLKVDVDALPGLARRAASSTGTVESRRSRRRRSRCSKLNAVVGVTGFFGRDGKLAVGGHPVRALPLDGRRLVRARHRPPPRRLGRTATSTSARSSNLVARSLGR